MDPVRRCTATALLFSFLALPVAAQDRDLRGERIFLDDNGDEGVTLVAPHPMPSGSSYTLTLPDSLPAGNFVLLGNSSGVMSALEPPAAFNAVAWLLSGNSGSNPAGDFLGTADSADLVFRTNGLERMRITADGNFGLGISSPASARFHLTRTFPDSVPVDPLFTVPLSFGARVESTSPAVADSSAIYVSSGNVTYITGSNDLTGAASFVGSAGLGVNANTGGGLNEVTGALGIAMQTDPAAAVAGTLRGMSAGAQISGGTVANAVGLSADVSAQSATISRASGISSFIGVGSGGTVNEGYGLYVASPYVDPAASMPSFTGLEIENLADSGRTAIRYNGSGTNAPFIIEGDGDAGVGTTDPGQARLRVVKTFADSVSVDSLLGIPVTFGLRTDVTSPAAAFPGGVYVGSATLSRVEGVSDMSTAGQFVGSAAVVQNSNTGGTLNGMLGLVGQVVQSDPAAATQFLAGIQAQAALQGGTAGQVSAAGGSIEIGGNASVSDASVLSAGLQVADNAAVTNGYGLMVQSPFVAPGATLTNYIGINVENLPDSGQVAFRYNGSGSNMPFIIEGDGDAGVGTTDPGEARLRVVKTFADSVSVDPFFNEQISFGLRVDAFSPANVDSASVYVASVGLMRLQGGNDLSDAESFVGNAGLAVNSNTGGMVGGLLGLIGQTIQDNPAAAVDFMAGTMGSVRVEAGTLGTGIGGLGSIEMEGGSATGTVGLLTQLDLRAGTSVTNGVGLLISDPTVDPAATLSDFTGIRIESLNNSAYTAFRYDGTGANAPFVIEGDGDVGIGDAGPDARLDVENNDATVPALAVANLHTDGIGLQIDAGGVVLSYASGAPASIPVGTAAFDVNDNTPASAPNVGVPAGGTDGQILYIYVSDPDGATVGGNGYVSGDRLTYLYMAGGWRLFHVN